MSQTSCFHLSVTRDSGSCYPPFHVLPLPARLPVRVSPAFCSKNNKSKKGVFHLHLTFSFFLWRNEHRKEARCWQMHCVCIHVGCCFSFLTFLLHIYNWEIQEHASLLSHIVQEKASMWTIWVNLISIDWHTHTHTHTHTQVRQDDRQPTFMWQHAPLTWCDGIQIPRHSSLSIVMYMGCIGAEHWLQTQ